MSSVAELLVFLSFAFPLPAGRLPANGEKRRKWPNASFPVVFLSAWNSFTSGAACLWPKHFNQKMHFCSWAPFFPLANFKTKTKTKTKKKRNSILGCICLQIDKSSSLPGSRFTLHASLLCCLLTEQDLNGCHAFGFQLGSANVSRSRRSDGGGRM